METHDPPAVFGWLLLFFMGTVCLAGVYMGYRGPKAQPVKTPTPPPAQDTSGIQIALLAAALNASRVTEQKACEERDAWKAKALAAEAPRDGGKTAALEKALRDAVKALREANAETLATRKQRDVWKQERDTWRDRARAAERRPVAQEPSGPQSVGPDRQFKRLRALLASEFHPDHAKTDGIERLVRGEIFKTLWPKVQDIEKSSVG
jgi:hypothetical protein